MRDARAEAAERVGGRWDVRVLEPSPPAVSAPPYLADDPVAGGEVVPVERPGSRSWAQVCDDEGDAALRDWCAERWLVRRPLDPLPAGFAAARAALHDAAEKIVSPARSTATGKIGLRFTFRGFGTPFFGADRQVRVEDGVLVDGDLRRGLDVDAVAARAVGDWFGFATSLLEQVRADARPDDDPARVQLWPEHFDVAVDLGPEGRRANFGGSPGDEAHPEPYLYVGPWEPRPQRGFWNEAWGAALAYAEVRAGADPLAFFAQARAELASG